MHVETSTAAATAVLGFDLLSNSIYRFLAPGQQIQRVGLSGSAAAGDAEIELFAGTQSLGRFFNQATGFPAADATMFLVGYTNRTGQTQSVAATVVDAPATNPLNFAMDRT